MFVPKMKMTGRRKHRLAILLSIKYLSTVSSLNVAVITGSTRTDGPPRPILGPRVCKYIQNNLENRGLDVKVLNPIELNLPLLQKPEFAYSKSQIPPNNLREIKDILTAADAYVTITPEYNHAPSPGLINILNHFGSSIFSYKPSAIITYSAGQWGGSRAAIALRPILSELGCLPVSAMIHIPMVQNVINTDGNLIDENDINEWDTYLDRCFSVGDR